MIRQSKIRITKSAVDAMQPGDELRDGELNGFGVRRQATATSYFVHTRIRGRLKRLTIGRHGSPWTPETARKQAAAMLMSIRAGGDPAAERDLQRKRRQTLGDIADSFIDLHVGKLKPSTQESYRSVIRLHIVHRLGARELEAIDGNDVARAHAAWRATPRLANLCVSVLSKMMNWAQQQGYCKFDKNPCDGVGRYRETKRERYLSADELHRLGQALHVAETTNQCSPFVVAAVRLLVLTGARRSEVLTLRWDYIDFDSGRIRLPDSKTGAKTVQLNSQAVDVLTAIPRVVGNPWVLVGHRHGSHLVNIQKPWEIIRALAQLDDLRLHDLRHSFASMAVGVGGSLPVIGSLLGHRVAQTTARYAHVAPDPARELAQATGDQIARVFGKAKD